MANYSYLCTTATRATYPSFTEANYDPSAQTIACDVSCVPLLWLGLFRAGDIVARTFVVEGQKVPTEAPVVERAAALENLRESVSYFNVQFASEGPLDEYAALLAQALAEVDHAYVTIELQEIACLGDESVFYKMVRDALSDIGGPPTAEAKRRLVQLSQLKPGFRFPPARLLLDGLDGPDEDFWNFCRICGAGAAEAGIGRPVPWEPE